MLYEKLKNVAYFIFPKETIKKNKQLLRKLYAPFFMGNKHECTICKKKCKQFIQINNHQDNLCPFCGSISRDRRLFPIISTKLAQSTVQKTKVLDFSPSDSIYNQLSKNKKIDYKASDLSGNFNAAYQYDLTNIACEDNFFDYIICFHILEHIIDDAKAMSELFRILKPNGLVFIQTPFKEGEIYEDFSIVTPQEREKHFGQDDHVRVYSINGLAERLRKAGFQLELTNFEKDEYLGLKANETIIFASKKA